MLVDRLASGLYLPMQPSADEVVTPPIIVHKDQEAQRSAIVNSIWNRVMLPHWITGVVDI